MTDMAKELAGSCTSREQLCFYEVQLDYTYVSGPLSVSLLLS